MKLPQTSEAMATAALRLPTALYRRVRIEAASTGRTITDCVTEALTEWLQGQRGRRLRKSEEVAS